MSTFHFPLLGMAVFLQHRILAQASREMIPFFIKKVFGEALEQIKQGFKVPIEGKGGGKVPSESLDKGSLRNLWQRNWPNCYQI